MILIVKKGENFKCWKCKKDLITNVKVDIYADTLIDDMSKYCIMRTQSQPSLRAGKTPLDNISKCGFCGVYAYEKLLNPFVYKLKDELFEI